MPIPPPYIPKVETPNIATMYLQGMMLKKEMDKQAADAEAAQQKLNIDTIRLGVEMEKLGIEKSKVATEERKNETYRLAAEKLGGANNPFNDLGVMFLSGGDPKAAHDWLNLGRSADKDTLDLIEQQASGLLAVYDKEGLPGYQKAKAALQGTYDPQVIERLLPASLENNPNQLRGVLSGIAEGTRKGVTINMEGEAKKAGVVETAKQTAQYHVKKIEAADRAAENAIKQNYDLDLISGALNTEGVYTGFGADTVQAAKKFAAAMGMNVQGLGETDLLNSVTNRMALILRNPESGMGLPGAMSDNDLRFMRSIPPSLQNTKQGNFYIMQGMRIMNDRVLDRRDKMESWMSEHGSLEGFEADWRKWVEENPVWKRMWDKHGIPPPIFNDSQYESLSPGTTFFDVKGGVYRKK